MRTRAVNQFSLISPTLFSFNPSLRRVDLETLVFKGVAALGFEEVKGVLMEKVAFHVLWGVFLVYCVGGVHAENPRKRWGQPWPQAERTLDLVPSNPASQRQSSAQFVLKVFFGKLESAKETAKILGFSAVVFDKFWISSIFSEITLGRDPLFIGF